MKNKISHEEVRMFFHYDSETGVMKRTFKPDRWGNILPHNKIISYIDRKSGYIICNFKGVVYKVHRLACLYMTGSFPAGEVDHINGDRLDNRWENIRVVTRNENRRNIGVRKDNSSGYPGVDFHNVVGKFQARININGERKRLGFFETKEEAIKEKQKYEKLLGFHPNHGKRNGWSLEEQ
jgi:hypothetical protein